MNKASEEKRTWWMLVTMGMLICFGGLMSCKTTDPKDSATGGDVPANEGKPGSADLPFRKPVEPSKPSLAQEEPPGIAQSNESAQQLIYRSLALGEQGKSAEAEALLRRAIELDPKNARAHRMLGFALGRQGKYAEAEAVSRRTVELDPKSGMAHAMLAASLGRQGKSAEAEAASRRAIELDPNYAEAHFQLGYALKEQGKHAESAESFRRAKELGAARP